MDSSWKIWKQGVKADATSQVAKGDRILIQTELNKTDPQDYFISINN